MNLEEAERIELFATKGQTMLDGTIWKKTKNDLVVDSRGIVQEKEYSKKTINWSDSR